MYFIIKKHVFTKKDSIFRQFSYAGRMVRKDISLNQPRHSRKRRTLEGVKVNRTQKDAKMADRFPVSNAAYCGQFCGFPGNDCLTRFF